MDSISSKAAESGVNIIGNVGQPAPTNQFFLERAQSLSIDAGEPQLVDFLYKLGSGSSMIRVRDLTLRPDAPRFRLTGNIKLVASYQKKITARPTAGSTAPPAAPAAKPATSTKK